MGFTKRIFRRVLESGKLTATSPNTKKIQLREKLDPQIRVATDKFGRHFVDFRSASVLKKIS